MRNIYRRRLVRTNSRNVIFLISSVSCVDSSCSVVSSVEGFEQQCLAKRKKMRSVMRDMSTRGLRIQPSDLCDVLSRRNRLIDDNGLL